MTGEVQPPRRRLPTSNRGRTQDIEHDGRIIEATLELLREGGYNALTMTEVAARTGISKATLYRRWTTKADLVADAVDTLNQLTQPDYPGTSIRDDLLALLEQAGSCDNRPDIVTATFEMARTCPELYETLRNRFVVFIQQEIAKLAQRAVAEGYEPLSEVETRLVSETVVALITYYAGPTGVPVSHESLIEAVDHVLLFLLTGSRKHV